MDKPTWKTVAVCLGLIVAYLAGFDALWQIRLSWTPPSQTTAKLLVAAVFLSLTGVFAILVPRLRLAVGKFGAAAVCLTAVAIYAVAVIVPPLGIGDIYHYAIMARGWLIHGLTPYSIVPANLAGDPLFSCISPTLHGEPSIYGPLWVAISAAPVLLTKSASAEIILMKILSVLSYAGAGLLLARELRGKIAPAFFLSIWLLNPLAVFEIGNNGHNEGFLILLLTAFIIGLLRRSPQLALPALTAAVAMKYWPIIFVPALLGLRGASRRAWLHGAIISITVAVTPFLILGMGPTAPILPIASHQAQVSPHNFSPAFAAVWGVLVALGQSADGAFSAAQGIGAAAILIMISVTGWAIVKKRISVISACGLIIAAFFLFSVSWLQPWYLLSVLPLIFLLPAPNSRLPVLVALNAVAFLSYPFPWYLTVPVLLLSVIVTLTARNSLPRDLFLSGISAKPGGMRQ
jgi:hypothetical protein